MKKFWDWMKKNNYAEDFSYHNLDDYYKYSLRDKVGNRCGPENLILIGYMMTYLRKKRKYGDIVFNGTQTIDSYFKILCKEIEKLEKIK